MLPKGNALNIGQFLRNELPNSTSRHDALVRLARYLKEVTQADGAMVALYNREARSWAGYCPEHPTALGATALSRYASSTFLDEVRAANQTLFHPLQMQGVDSKSWAGLQIKHAIGAPLRDLCSANRAAGNDFAGVLYLDRRTKGHEFDAQDVDEITACGLTASYAIHVMNDFELTPQRVKNGEPSKAHVQVQLSASMGNVAAAWQKLQDFFDTREAFRAYINRHGLQPLINEERQRYSVEGISELILKLRDLRKVGRALGARECSKVHRFLRSRGVPRGLRGLVESLGLDWMQVRGPEYEATKTENAR